MKGIRLFKWLLIFGLSFRGLDLCSQVTSAGDLAFTAYNADSGDDFALLTLVDISANTTIYITDKAWDGTSAFTGSEGIITWDSGASVIKAGTVVVFSDVSNSSTLAVATGTVSSSGNFNISASGETVLVYLGTDANTPTTFITGFKNTTLTAGELNNTGLTAGTNFLEFNPSASPDGGYYMGSRSSEISYTNYLPLLYNLSNWNYENSNGELILPISQSGFTIHTTTWTGATDADWNTAGNWDSGIPDNSYAVTIPNVVTSPIINTSGVIVGNLMIDTSAALTINAGKSITVSGDLNNSGTLTVNSDASSSGSLIVTGTATGNLKYKRYLTGVDKWHLIGAPVSGQSINSFVTDSNNHVASSGVNYSLTPYDNNGTAWSTHWTSDATNPVSGAGNFVSGKGYEILTTADGTVTFTGTVPVAQVDIPITQGTTNSWNLIANPFPASIPANSNADTFNNIISLNTAVLEASYQAVYSWNPISSTYDIINQATASTFLAPGQGFFVKSVLGGGTLSFPTAMQAQKPTVAFRSIASTNPSIILTADDLAGHTSTTDIKYTTHGSLGLDPGFDAGRFDAESSSFSLYTHLVTDNGVDFALQVLPDTVYNTAVIPIGLDAPAGSQVRFKAQATDLPVGIKVFLEDRLLNKTTEINNTDKSYSVTLSESSQGIGRFYLKTSDNASTLAVAKINTEPFRIVAKPEQQRLLIYGVIKQPTTLLIYDSLGHLVLTKILEVKPYNTIAIPKLATGIYIVKLKNNKHFSTKIAWY